MDSPETSTTFKVLMLPWLAHGHISPFLELAKKLSKRKLHVYFCSTPINLNSIQKNSSLTLQFIELNLPSLFNLPPCYHTTNGLPPHLMSTLVRAFEMASPCISAILESLSPDLLIYDIYQSWVPPLALSHHIPAVHFQTSAASTMSFFLRLYKHRATPFPFPAIYIRESEIRRMSPVAPSSDASLNDKDLMFKGIEQSDDIILIKSCGEIEGKYIDFLSNLSKKKIISVGPLVQDIVVDDDDRNEIIRWLNEKDPFSSVFVSFGSEYFLSEEEMEEIAYGLELSGVNFVWVIRFSAGERKEIEEVVPKGFLERTKERGMLVKGWAPQAKILGHSSIGGFVSHCGWSSVMESISFGVPIIALPMQLDQPLNARLVVEVGVGAEVMKGENGEFKREELARVIKQVVVEESGEYVRKKAKELSKKIRMNGEEEIDVLVGELAQLCEKNK